MLASIVALGSGIRGEKGQASFDRRKILCTFGNQNHSVILCDCRIRCGFQRNV